MSATFSEPLSRAYGACVALARSHYENFPVATWLLPAPMRPHVAAVYAFARVADDLADEGQHADEVRRLRLATWRARLHDAVDAPRSASDNDDPQTLMLVAASHTIRSLHLPLSLFDDLISAFVQDTTTSRYDSWAGLFDYCRRSANPVGRLVLRIAGYRDPAIDKSSDALCTALQLTNFWQDFGPDWRGGRLYVPREVQLGCRAREGDLGETLLTEPWVAAIHRCVEVTRQSFAEGRHVCDAVRGRLRFELRLTWQGGWRVLDKVERTGADLLRSRPVLGRGDAPALLWNTCRWKGSTV